MIAKLLMTLQNAQLPAWRWQCRTAMHGRSFAAGFSSPLAVPSAFLYSEADSVTVTRDIQTVAGKWRAAGSDVEEGEFEGTKHVMHLQSFPEQYEAAVGNVLRKAVLDGPAST